MSSSSSYPPELSYEVGVVDYLERDAEEGDDDFRESEVGDEQVGHVLEQKHKT